MTRVSFSPWITRNGGAPGAKWAVGEDSGSSEAGPKYPPRQNAYYQPPDASFEHMRSVLKALHFERGVIVHPMPYDTDHSLLIDTLASLHCDGAGTFATDFPLLMLANSCGPEGASRVLLPSWDHLELLWEPELMVSEQRFTEARNRPYRWISTTEQLMRSALSI